MRIWTYTAMINPMLTFYMALCAVDLHHAASALVTVVVTQTAASWRRR